MRLLNNLFVIYTPLYVYVMLAIYFIVLLKSGFSESQSYSFSNYYLTNKSFYRLVYFFVIISALLGTPPTLGFFAKILIFYNLAGSNIYYIGIITILNLILIIFYLQTMRGRLSLKKKSICFLDNYSLNNIIIFNICTLVIVNFYFFSSIIFDIIYTFFI